MIEVHVLGSDLPALVDDDFAYFTSYKWALDGGYARRNSSKAERASGAPVKITMHRQVAGLQLTRGAPGLPEVDHIHAAEKLNNQRSNLRIVTRSINNLNRHAQVGRSRYTGVSFFKPAKLWRAYITLDRRRYDLGYFKTEEEAAAARRDFETRNLPEKVGLS